MKTRKDPSTDIQECARPLRICFMIDNLARAGVETQLVQIINQLDRSVLQPFLCILAPYNETTAELLPSNCPVMWLGLTSMKRPSALYHAWKLMSYLRKNRIDIFHLDLPGSTLFGIPVGWVARVPYLVRTRRDLGYWMKPLDRWTGRLYSHLVDMTITNCRTCRDSIMEIERARPESIAILNNHVDIETFREIPLANSFPQHRSPRVVGMVANLRPEKAPEVFIDAAQQVIARHDDVEFRIAGEGELRLQLEQQIRDYGLQEKVKLPGRIIDIPQFLSEVDVAVLSSRTEGMPNVIVEYMAAGRPVIATDVGGTRELIEDQLQGLVVPSEDSGALAKAIDRLLSDDELAARLAKAARARVDHEYGGPPIGVRFQELMLNMLKPLRQRCLSFGQ